MQINTTIISGQSQRTQTIQLTNHSRRTPCRVTRARASYDWFWFNFWLDCANLLSKSCSEVNAKLTLASFSKRALVAILLGENVTFFRSKSKLFLMNGASVVISLNFFGNHHTGDTRCNGQARSQASRIQRKWFHELMFMKGPGKST